MLKYVIDQLMQKFNSWEVEVKKFSALEKAMFAYKAKLFIYIKLLNILPLERYNVPTRKINLKYP